MKPCRVWFVGMGFLLAAQTSAHADKSNHRRSAANARVEHKVLSVRATDDSWQSAGISVSAGDYVIVKSTNKLVGRMVGDGLMTPNSKHNGRLRMAIGYGYYTDTNKQALVIAPQSGPIRFRVEDSKYRGLYQIQVLVLRKSSIPKPSYQTRSVSGSGIGYLEQLARRACRCSSRTCAGVVLEQFKRFMIANKDNQVSRREAERAGKAAKNMTTCLLKTGVPRKTISKAMVDIRRARPSAP